ncbi:MAG: primosomal protein N', partial [Acutalibacter sp.]|nr:primosomal protein N' [Acutalibacter sp.]
MLADMNWEDYPGSENAIGSTLAEALAQNLEQGKQSIVLLNRRGYHTFVSCRSCREVVSCPNCSISLTYHSANRRLMCHYCGYSTPLLKKCPTCGSDRLAFRGLGTQKAEEQLR